MEYITTRSFSLFDSEEMERHVWFNMWKKKFFPYDELFEGDVIYWYEAKSKHLIYKSEVNWVNTREYKNKQELIYYYQDNYQIDLGGKYFDEGADFGYFLIFTIKILSEVNIERPANFNFAQFGWARLDEKTSEEWFGKTEEISLEGLTTPGKSIFEQLKELNEKMKGASAQRKQKLVNKLIRNDSAMVSALKRAANYKCQFSGCGHQIKTKQGGYYIEVAHINSVAKGGQSILGNLIVLCPNHHKEFDHGDLIIADQSLNQIKGNVNGKEFDIVLYSV